MTHKLKFLPVALKEWNKLAPPIKNQFKKKLKERLENKIFLKLSRLVFYIIRLKIPVNLSLPHKNALLTQRDTQRY